MTINPMLMVDGYKLGHHDQYPEGMEFLFSNFTARSNKNFAKIAVKEYMDDNIVVFGTSAVVKYITDVWNEGFFRKPKEEVISEYTNIVRLFLGDDSFSAQHFEALHDLGFLPIVFDSLEEGKLCPIGVPFFTLRSTHSEFAWLVNYLETQISAMLWKPVTTATVARHYKKILKDFYVKTGSDINVMDFMVHDFSMRGLSGVEDAMFAGMGHPTAFKGSDNLPALLGVKKYYGYDVEKNMLCMGVPATEHSVTSSNIQSYMSVTGTDSLSAELMTISKLLKTYPTGILSYVSDTYDYFGVLTDVLPRLKNLLMARDGKFVVRPDTGNPIDIVCGEVREVSIDDLRNMSGICVGDKVCVRTEGGKIYYSVNPVNADGYTVGHKLVEFEPTPEDKGTLELLWETFGGTFNSKGYRVLDSHIGLIYGDSITPQRMYEILKRMGEMGFAASNVCFGAGSFTYQYLTRDTFGMAMKATHCVVKGQEVKLFKDPKTGDGSKKSAKGMFLVKKDSEGKLVLHDNLTQDQWVTYGVADELKSIQPGLANFETIRKNVDASL